MNITFNGTVCSHTTIRVAGKMHAQDAPFVLLLVGLDDGRRVLGRFRGTDPPAIGGRVSGATVDDQSFSFSVLQDTP